MVCVLRSPPASAADSLSTATLPFRPACLLPELLAQFAINQDIASITANGGYDTRKCHNAIAERGAHAVIPPRKNAKQCKSSTTDAIAHNEALRASKYQGHPLWRPLSAAPFGCACRAVDGAATTAGAVSKPTLS